MTKVLGRILALAVVVLLAAGGPAAADAAYHSERLTFDGGADPDFHGQVVNIHPNGPVHGALERYQVVRAEASTTYQVWIQLCGNGGFADFIQTTQLTTNRQGNGHASAGFSTQELVPFSGFVVDIRWVLKVGGTVRHATPCTTVTID